MFNSIINAAKNAYGATVNFAKAHPFATGVTVGAVVTGVVEAKYHVIENGARKAGDWNDRRKAMAEAKKAEKAAAKASKAAGTDNMEPAA